MRCFVASLVLLSLSLSLAAAEPAQTPAPVALAVRQSLNSTTIPPYEVLELTLQNEQAYANPFLDVAIAVTFTSPKGKTVTVGGFHYGCADKPEIRVGSRGPGGNARDVQYVFPRADLWKARFAPSELGKWTYTYVFSDLNGGRAEGSGSFQCVAGRLRNPGFVRPDPKHPYRWVFDDGSPYFPLGVQTGAADEWGLGSFLSEASMEGPFRTDRTLPWMTLPPGPLFARGPALNPQNSDVYFRSFSACGFNLFRYSQSNVSPPLYTDLDHYLPQQAIMTDELLQAARKYGFRIFYGLFGYQPVAGDHPEDAATMAKLQRFVKYSVDRWGAYVDFWQLLNEQKADARWYELMAPYLRSLDPYQHPITTSWERPELPTMEINAPHFYYPPDGYYGELNADRVVAEQAANWKKPGKPVVVGEAGNVVDTRKQQAPGVGGVWDPGSALRMRLRNWSALFNEVSFVYWNTSYARDGHYMNMWFGPQEREYVRAMQDFAYRLGGGLAMVPVTASAPAAVRAYGLASERTAGVYLHHYQNHDNPVTGVTVALEVPTAGEGYWYRPTDAMVLQRVPAPAGRQTFTAPDFTVDLALLITPDGPPDLDRDGLANDLDPDNDNDGVANAQDAFPVEPEEWADQDGDLIGDNLDADKNGDGVADDDNHNGVPDRDELDYDGDKVQRCRAVPWDAFPLNPKEWGDADGDGIGDNADPDLDGDGYPNADEIKAGTDPRDRVSFPMP